MASFFDIFRPFVREHMRNLDGLQVRVWLACLAHADEAMICWPSNATLAAMAGSDRRAVQRTADWLTRNGYLETIGNGGGRHTTKRRVSCPPVVMNTTRGNQHRPPVVMNTAPPVVMNTTAGAVSNTTQSTHRTTQGSTHRTTQARRARGADAVAVAGLVLPFQSEAFRTAWGDWQKHRSEIRKPLTETSATMQLKDMAAMGEAQAIASINFTIFKGWTGLREPDSGNAKPSKRAGEIAEEVKL